MLAARRLYLLDVFKLGEPWPDDAFPVPVQAQGSPPGLFLYGLVL